MRIGSAAANSRCSAGRADMATRGSRSGRRTAIPGRSRGRVCAVGQGWLRGVADRRSGRDWNRVGNRLGGWLTGSGGLHRVRPPRSTGHWRRPPILRLAGGQRKHRARTRCARRGRGLTKIGVLRPLDCRSHSATDAPRERRRVTAQDLRSQRGAGVVWGIDKVFWSRWSRVLRGTTGRGAPRLYAARLLSVPHQQPDQLHQDASGEPHRRVQPRRGHPLPGRRPPHAARALVAGEGQPRAVARGVRSLRRHGARQEPQPPHGPRAPAVERERAPRDPRPRRGDLRLRQPGARPLPGDRLPGLRSRGASRRWQDQARSRERDAQRRFGPAAPRLQSGLHAGRPGRVRLALEDRAVAPRGEASHRARALPGAPGAEPSAITSAVRCSSGRA